VNDHRAARERLDQMTLHRAQSIRTAEVLGDALGDRVELLAGLGATVERLSGQ
jgi:hypothetical protein